MKKKRNEKIMFLTVSFCLLITILISGCTTLNAEIDNTPVTTPTLAAETPVTAAPQQVITKPSVSWRDFYPEYDEQAKSRLIEEAKDEIMRVFPDVDRTTLKGKWVELGRFKEHDRPTVEFEELKYKSGDSREFLIGVDPESMKIVEYTPYGAQYGQPRISRKEAEAKAIDFIKLAQGEDSIANDPDAHMIVNRDNTDGRPIVSVIFLKTNGGVKYEHNNIHAEYDMSRDNIERYFDRIVNPELLSGLTTLSPEPDITFDEAIQIYEGLISKISDPDNLYDLENMDGLALEYTERGMRLDYLTWWDDEDIIYADNPDPIPLIWSAYCTNKKCRQEALETGNWLYSGIFRIDAHTGEVYNANYGNTNQNNDLISLV